MFKEGEKINLKLKSLSMDECQGTFIGESNYKEYSLVHINDSDIATILKTSCISKIEDKIEVGDLVKIKTGHISGYHWKVLLIDGDFAKIGSPFFDKYTYPHYLQINELKLILKGNP